MHWLLTLYQPLLHEVVVHVPDEQMPAPFEKLQTRPRAPLRGREARQRESLDAFAQKSEEETHQLLMSEAVLMAEHDWDEPKRPRSEPLDVKVYPLLHDAIEHVPDEHLPRPFETVHLLPTLPQLLTSVWRLSVTHWPPTR